MWCGVGGELKLRVISGFSAMVEMMTGRILGM